MEEKKYLNLDKLTLYDTMIKTYVDDAVAQKSQVQIVTSGSSEFVPTLKIHKMTQEEYERELANGTVDENALYLTPDEAIDLTPYITQDEVASSYETKADAIAKLEEAKEYTDANKITVDSVLNSNSTNPVQNKVVNTALSDKVPNTRTVNNYELSSDITLTATDIGGFSTYATGANAQAIGFSTHATGSNSQARGTGSQATGYCADASGYYTIAKDYQCSVGKYNAEKDAPASPDTQDSDGGDAIFSVGYGTSTTRGNAFRISSNGKCRGVSAFSGSGADFAELFEWVDGNPNNEDRRGLFVTLEGEKIRLANADDDYIGVISGAQAFIGNAASEEWQGKYLADVFGTKISQEIEVPEKIDETTGEVITPATTTTQYVLNPDYNPNEKYVRRENRKEWGIVGLLGQVVIIDDGTGVVGGYVKPSVNGIGTAASNGYRVMKRIDESHIKVLVK